MAYTSACKTLPKLLYCISDAKMKHYSRQIKWAITFYKLFFKEQLIDTWLEYKLIDLTNVKFSPLIVLREISGLIAN